MVTTMEITVSFIRWWVDVKQVGASTPDSRIYTGNRLDDLAMVASPVVDWVNGPSGAGTVTGSGVMYQVNFAPITIPAGMHVVVFFTSGTPATSVPTVGCTANQLASTVNSSICNPGKTTNIVSGFKALAPPLTGIKSVVDNTWTLRGLIPWVALG
jgi:hypothetical protein